MKVLPITETQSTDNYPYGSLRATATFAVEFVPKKGFRSLFQTVNPKTKRVNAPKKSTYTEFMLMYVDENGHFKQAHYSINGAESVGRVLNLLKEHHKEAQFTEEMLTYIKSQMMQTLIISRAWTKEDDKKEAITRVIEQFKDYGTNFFLHITDYNLNDK